MKLHINISFILFIFLCTACADLHHLAPVVRLDRPLYTPSVYLARSGDTIYSIAWDFGMDYLKLARANHIRFPYLIYPKQSISLTEVSHQMKRHAEDRHVHGHRVYFMKPMKPSMGHLLVKKVENRLRVLDKTLTQGWLWPAQGQLKQTYDPGHHHYGVTLVTKSGAKVVASAPGRVVYVGNKLRGYGELCLLKHNKRLISAYSGNQHVIVHIGQRIKRGQVIGYAHEHALPHIHFELRGYGKPVNPMLYLHKKGYSG